jgi:TonB family protein
MIDQLLFTPLQAPQSRLRHFMTGWGLQVAIIAGVLGFQALFPKAIPTATRYIAVNLIAPTPVPVDHTPQVRMHVREVVPPPTTIHVVTAPPVHREAPPVDAPVVVAKNDKVPDIMNNIPAPRPILNNFGSSAPQTTTKPAIKVQTGGFGDPNGVAPDPNAKRPGNIAAVGSFDLPQGGGHGNGLAGKNGVPGVTASAGFGNGTATGNGGHRVVVGGDSNFDKHVIEDKKLETKTVATALTTPAVIVYKPTPQYSEEAVRAKVEGVIKLRVTLTATGHVEILTALNSLGYGLDERAIAAAQQIKFKPAQQEGKDVDSTVVVSIIFELAS